MSQWRSGYGRRHLPVGNFGAAQDEADCGPFPCVSTTFHPAVIMSPTCSERDNAFTAVTKHDMGAVVTPAPI